MNRSGFGSVLDLSSGGCFGNFDSEFYFKLIFFPCIRFCNSSTTEKFCGVPIGEVVWCKCIRCSNEAGEDSVLEEEHHGVAFKLFVNKYLCKEGSDGFSICCWSECVISDR